MSPPTTSASASDPDLVLVDLTLQDSGNDDGGEEDFDDTMSIVCPSYMHTNGSDSGIDTASARDEDSMSVLASLSSSVQSHDYHHGRRYQARHSSHYILPNDEIEQDREELKHLMMMELTDNKHFLAPIEATELRKVIDLGTGTGTWAIEGTSHSPNFLTDDMC